MKIAVFLNKFDNEPKPKELTWEELTQELSECTRHETCDPPGSHCKFKDSFAWSPVDYGEALKRDKANVKSISAVVFDLDHLKRAEIDAASTKLVSCGYKYASHTTHSHNPSKADHCYRWILPLSRAVTPSENKLIREKLIEKLGLSDLWDESTKDESRLFYFPTAPEGAVFEFDMSTDTRRVFVEVDSLLGQNTLASLKAKATKTPAVDMFAVKNRLRKLKKESSKEIVNRVVNGEPLSDIGGRDDAVNKAASLLAAACPELPIEAALELLRPSIAGMPESPGEDFAHWMSKAEDCFERARERQILQEDHKKKLSDVVKKRLAGASKAEVKAEEFIALPSSGSDSEPVLESGVKTGNWEDQLLWAEDPEGNPKLKSCGANVNLLMQHAQEWKSCLRWNEVTKEIELVNSPLGFDPAPAVLDVELSNWFARSEYGLNIDPFRMGLQIAAVARANSYDPLKDYLLGLTWDKKPRLDSWLEDYLGVQIITDTGQNISDYVKLISRKWPLGCVKRALCPGEKVDEVLILEGPQGLLKSTAFKVLGGEYFSDSKLTIGDKDALQMASRVWLIELAELESLLKTESATAKAFFSSAIDMFRPPYGRVMEKSPRRAIFVGTINPDENGYLKDHTGNRRYWPVVCTNINIAKLKQDRDQLWAEAVVRIQAGEQHYLTKEEQLLTQQEAEDRVDIGNSLTITILKWWVGLGQDKRPDELSAQDIALQVLHLLPGQIEKAHETHIGRALKRLGFETYRRRGVGGILYRYYRPSAELKNLASGVVKPGMPGLLKKLETN